jgi:hypothetical protein
MNALRCRRAQALLPGRSGQAQSPSGYLFRQCLLDAEAENGDGGRDGERSRFRRMPRRAGSGIINLWSDGIPPGRVARLFNDPANTLFVLLWLGAMAMPALWGFGVTGILS